MAKLTLELGFILTLIHMCLCGLPSDIKKCNAGDGDCIARTINYILRKYPNGNEEMGMGNIEPMHLDELIVAKADGKSGVQLNFKITDLSTYGLSKMNVTKIVGFAKDIRTSKFEFYGTIPELKLRGKYETDGKILLLPITGKGNAEITLKNFKTGVKVKAVGSEHNGKLWATVDKIKVQSEPEFMTVKLENLFNGNKQLSDEINAVINKNWKDIWVELQSGINDGYRQIIYNLISNILKKISYDEFYSN